MAAASAATATARRIVIPLPNFKLPPTSLGCSGAAPAGGGATNIPITVSHIHMQVAATVNVCVSGNGPFPFVVDTGAAQSVVVSSLARRLGLQTQGQPEVFEGVGCTGTSRTVSVPAWSVAGVPLQAQTANAANIPGFGGRGQPLGLIGSDVWSRFGAIRVDFARGAIVVPGPEGPPPATGVGSGTGSGVTSPSLVKGQPRAVVPMSVESALGEVVITIPLRIGAHGETFAPDTGSSQTVINSGTAKSLHLRPTNVAARQTTVCSYVTVPLVGSGPWSIAGRPLRRQLIGSINLGTVQLAGFSGLLGSDAMSQFGSVVFDYAGGQFVLGAG